MSGWMDSPWEDEQLRAEEAVEAVAQRIELAAGEQPEEGDED